MILNSLYLNNIRSYKELELDFKTGTSLFEGDIGSGKSTILMAIEFALFGLGGIKGNSLLRAGEKNGIVRLNFSVDEEEYEVQRKLSRARTTVSHARDDCYFKDKQGKLPLSPSELKPKILEVLNFNEPTDARAKSVIFTYAIFTPQEEMKSIISENPDRRLQTLRKAFRIEDYKIAVNNANMIYKEIDKKSGYLEGAANGLKEDEDQKKVIESKIKEDAEKTPLLKKQENEEIAARKKITIDLKKKRDQRIKLSEVAGQIPVIEQRIIKNEKEIDRLEKSVEIEKKEADKHKQQMDKLSEITKTTSKTIKELESDMKEIELDEAKLRRNEGAIESKIQEYKTVKEKGTCPTCDRPAKPEEFEEKARIKESEKAEIAKQLKDLADEKKGTNELLERLENYESAQEKIAGFKERFEGVKNRIKDSTDRIKDLKGQVKEDIQFVKRAKDDHKKLEALVSEIEELELQDDEKEKAIQKITGEIATINERIRKSKEQVKDLTKLIESKKGYLESSNKLKEYIVWIRDYFIPTVEIIEKSVLASINEEFNEKFKEWFSILVEDNTKDARIDEDFTPIVEQDGYEQDIQFLSGGEKTSVALSYRLALNSLVQKVSTGMRSNLLILDEPTDGFSKEQLYKVRDILNELRCPQVILVSHEKELESFADHIYRVVKTNGVSELIV